MSPGLPIRIMVVDDHAVVRDGIRSLLVGYEDIAVVTTAGSATEALERCRSIALDVVLMDLSMPGMDGVEATAHLLEVLPTVRVVVLTGFVDDGPIRAAIDAGASACLLKTVGADELVEAIRGVVAGRSTFSSEFLTALSSPTPSTSLSSGLTPREHEILTLLTGGQTNKDIARALGLSDGTVRMYVSTILAKLGAANRTEASVLAIRQGLVDLEG